ncbi:transposable element Tcb1 transposase [Trichonephila clavipes]|nr:transposable element Tcb1 transposase [Trichonephila clavipes]
MENMWFMVAQRLTQITPPAATPDQLWQRVDAAWSAVPQEHIQSLFESMPRRVAADYINLKYEAISVPQGSVHLVKKAQERKVQLAICGSTKVSRVRAQYH